MFPYCFVRKYLISSLFKAFTSSKSFIHLTHTWKPEGLSSRRFPRFSHPESFTRRTIFPPTGCSSSQICVQFNFNRSSVLPYCFMRNSLISSLFKASRPYIHRTHAWNPEDLSGRRFSRFSHPESFTRRAIFPPTGCSSSQICVQFNFNRSSVLPYCFMRNSLISSLFKASRPYIHRTHAWNPEDLSGRRFSRFSHPESFTRRAIFPPTGCSSSQICVQFNFNRSSVLPYCFMRNSLISSLVGIRRASSCFWNVPIVSPIRERFAPYSIPWILPYVMWNPWAFCVCSLSHLVMRSLLIPMVLLSSLRFRFLWCW